MSPIRNCHVLGCENNSNNCSKSFFKVPNDERRQEWIKRIGSFKANSKYLLVCSDHFSLASFSDTFRRRLLSRALPLFASEYREKILNKVPIIHTIDRNSIVSASDVEVKEEPAYSDPDESLECQEVLSCKLSPSSPVSQRESLVKEKGTQKCTLQVKEEPADSYPHESIAPQKVSFSGISGSPIVSQKESLIKIDPIPRNNVQVKEPSHPNCNKQPNCRPQSQIDSSADKSEDLNSSTIIKEEPLNNLGSSYVKNVQVFFQRI